MDGWDLPRNLLKITSLYFRSSSEDSCRIAMVKLLVSYLESTVATATREMIVVFRSTGCAYFTYRVLYCWISHVGPIRGLPEPEAI